MSDIHWLDCSKQRDGLYPKLPGSAFILEDAVAWHKPAARKHPGGSVHSADKFDRPSLGMPPKPSTWCLQLPSQLSVAIANNNVLALDNGDCMACKESEAPAGTTDGQVSKVRTIFVLELALQA